MAVNVIVETKLSFDPETNQMKVEVIGGVIKIGQFNGKHVSIALGQNNSNLGHDFHVLSMNTSKATIDSRVIVYDQFDMRIPLPDNGEGIIEALHHVKELI